MSQGENAHVKKILPPSLGGLPGEAEIQYYVKATVQRAAFYKENFRAVSGLVSSLKALLAASLQSYDLSQQDLQLV